MRVYARSGVGRSVDREVHRRLRGDGQGRVKRRTVQPDHADVAGAPVSVANSGWRDKDHIAKPHAQIARAADGQTVVDQAGCMADELLTSHAELTRIAVVHQSGW